MTDPDAPGRGRVVPIPVALNAYQGAPQAVIDTALDYVGDPDVKVKVVYNRGSLGSAHEIDLRHLNRVEYDWDELEFQLAKGTYGQLQNGAITEEVFERTGAREILESRDRRGAPQGQQGLPSESEAGVLPRRRSGESDRPGVSEAGGRELEPGTHRIFAGEEEFPVRYEVKDLAEILPSHTLEGNRLSYP